MVAGLPFFRRLGPRGRMLAANVLGRLPPAAWRASDRGRHGGSWSDPAMRKIRERVERQLRDLERELRHELPKEIERATALGDLRENAEYHAALERQTLVRARIGQLKLRLSQLSTMSVSKLPRDRAGFGSLVTVRDLDDDSTKVFDLVLGEDGDPRAGKISVSSPIGRSLVGKQVGDDVTVRTPSGERAFEIVELVTLHDRGDAGQESPNVGTDG